MMPNKLFIDFIVNGQEKPEIKSPSKPFDEMIIYHAHPQFAIRRMQLQLAADLKSYLSVTVTFPHSALPEQLAVIGLIIIFAVTADQFATRREA